MDELSDAEIDAAIERGKARRDDRPRALSARYDAASGQVVVALTNGCTFGFPACLAQGLEAASGSELEQVEVLGSGSGLHWEALDVDLSLPDLLAGLFGTRAHMARLAGRVRSAAKAEASRANGKRGGRPRKAIVA